MLWHQDAPRLPDYYSQPHFSRPAPRNHIRRAVACQASKQPCCEGAQSADGLLLLFAQVFSFYPRVHLLRDEFRSGRPAAPDSALFPCIFATTAPSTTWAIRFASVFTSPVIGSVVFLWIISARYGAARRILFRLQARNLTLRPRNIRRLVPNLRDKLRCLHLPRPPLRCCPRHMQDGHDSFNRMILLG